MTDHHALIAALVSALEGCRQIRALLSRAAAVPRVGQLELLETA